MTRCTFKQGNYNCGSYAFNLYKEDIDQGSYCDRHYWQDQAQKARADEREACAKVVDDIESRCIAKDVDDPPLNHVASAIRARGEQA
jgi:hypothetical protein